ncbi:MAG TPA: hypothetical protein VJ754_02030, partial [Anaerolineae bacterium]|nr:hypothetical protein [Anaerolineae bacterium]
ISGQRVEPFMSGTGRVLNQLTTLVLGLTGLLALVYALILIFPQFPLNPFRPPVIAGNPLALTVPASLALATPIPSATRPPTWTPTPTLPGPTFSPFKFTKTNDPITFKANPYGAPCGSWLGIAGQALDRDGTPLPDVSVVGWGGPVTEQNKRVFVSGSSARINSIYGSPAAYEIYIGAQGEFEVSLQIYENGQPVSDLIRLRTSASCGADLALVHFQRNH